MSTITLASPKSATFVIRFSPIRTFLIGIQIKCHFFTNKKSEKLGREDRYREKARQRESDIVRLERARNRRRKS